MAETATIQVPSPATPIIPDIPVRSRPPVSNKILESARKVRQQFDLENEGKKDRIAARKNPPVSIETVKPEATNATPNNTDSEKLTTTTSDDSQAGLKIALSGDKETNMAALRKAREEAETRAKTLEQQLTEAQGRIPTDYEQLKKDRDLLISEIEKRDVTASPRFKEKYDKPMEQQLGQIKKTLSLTEVNSDDFLVVVQMPESKERNAKLGELMEGLDRVSSGKVETALSQFDSIRDQRSQDMADPKASWQESQRDLQEKHKKAQEQQRSILESAITKAETNIPWFKKIDGNETWNKRLDDTKQRARDFWSGAHSTEELAELTLSGTLTPLFVEALGLAGQENERLNNELSELKGAKPKTVAGTSSSASTGTSDKYKGFGNLGAFVRAKAQGKTT